MADSPLPDSSASKPDPRDGSIFGPVHLTRGMILVAAIVFAVFFYQTARWLPWPTEPGFRGSLAQPKMALGGFLVAIVLLVVCTIVGTVFLGRRWYLAGLMAATAALATWSVRGGTMTAVLFNAQDSGANRAVFVQMIGELIVFFGVIAALWNLIWNARDSIRLKAADSSKPSWRVSRNMWVGMLGVTGLAVHSVLQEARDTAQSRTNEEGRSTPAALLAQTAIMLMLMLLFIVTPMKKQVLTSIFIAGVISTAIAEYSFADRRAGRWYWIAPLAVGVIGYAAGYFAPAGLETGDLQGVFAPLTRALPLDYASMGCAGVLFGYWWMEPERSPTEPDPAIEGDMSGKHSRIASTDAPAKPATDAA